MDVARRDTGVPSGLPHVPRHDHGPGPGVVNTSGTIGVRPFPLVVLAGIVGNAVLVRVAGPVVVAAVFCVAVLAAWMVAMARDARRADDRWAVHQTQCIACATPEVIAAAIAAQKAREVAAVRVDVVDEVIVEAEPVDIPEGWTTEQPERVAEGVYRTAG